MANFWLAALFLLLSAVTHGQQTVQLYINPGVIDTGQATIPYYTFTTSQSFDSSNTVLTFQPGTTVNFQVTNNTNFNCGFKLTSGAEINSIPPGGTASVSETYTQPGTHVYYDPLPGHRYLGLAGMIVVDNFTGPSFYANFFEHDGPRIDAVLNQTFPINSKYRPDLFTINGRYFPRTVQDTVSHVKGKVGETIRIYFANTGHMYHFPHFHGYHVKVLWATHHSHYKDWIKDSFGLAPLETMAVELIPDKPGIYPVHNHNLITVTFGGNYPGGMIMRMAIDP